MQNYILEVVDSHNVVIETKIFDTLWEMCNCIDYWHNTLSKGYAINVKSSNRVLN